MLWFDSRPHDPRTPALFGHRSHLEPLERWHLLRRISSVQRRMEEFQLLLDNVQVNFNGKNNVRTPTTSASELMTSRMSSKPEMRAWPGDGEHIVGKGGKTHQRKPNHHESCTSDGFQKHRP
jgi:hypothetical protein